MNVPLVLESLRKLENTLDAVTDPELWKKFNNVLSAYPVDEFSRREVWALRQMQANAEARIARLQNDKGS